MVDPSNKEAKQKKNTKGDLRLGGREHRGRDVDGVDVAVVGAGGRAAAAAAAAAAIVDVDVDVDVDDFAEPRRIRRRHRGLQSANGAARELLATARQRRGKPAAIFFFCDDNNNNNNNSNNNAKGTRRTFGRTRFDGRAASQFLFDDDDEKKKETERKTERHLVGV